MAMLINSVDDLKSHVSVSSHFDFAKVLPFVRQTERKHIKGLIGAAQYEILSAAEVEPGAVFQVKGLMAEASACYAMVQALPIINSSVTNSGVKTNTNEQTDKAQWYEVRDLIRTYYNSGSEAIDEALAIMEANPASFTAWSGSANYTVFKDLVVRSTSEFNKGFDIQNKRSTFLSLQPYIREVQEQYLEGMLGDCLSVLKADSADTIVKRAQELARLAVISLSVAKAATAGTFSFTPTGMMVYAMELPWDRSKGELSAEQLCKLQEDRQNSGEEYLKKLKAHIVANAAAFPCYTTEDKPGIESRIIKLNSGLTI